MKRTAPTDIHNSPPRNIKAGAHETIQSINFKLIMINVMSCSAKSGVASRARALDFRRSSGGRAGERAGGHLQGR